MEDIVKKIVYVLKFIFYVIITLPRDFRAFIMVTRLKRQSKYVDRKNLTVSDYYQRWLKRQPNKPCLVSDDQKWTFLDLEIYGNKIANLFSTRYGLHKGDCVALFMENRPEFVGIWYGLSKLGVITACINTNLKLNVLLHSIDVAKAKLLIYDDELESKVAEIKNDLKVESIVKLGNSKPGDEIDALKSVQRLSKLLENSSDLFTPPEKVLGSDILMYIYTSGTTGLPKPAIIKHNRYIAGGFSFFQAAKLSTDDIFYVTLPIYHSNAGVIGIGAALISGGTAVLRKKFSASNFWKDCIKYECTAFSYVGEVCRYLLNQPESELDRKHKVKVCIGNGMRDKIQSEFDRRFGIKAYEIYGATEGNCILVNTEGKYGACGFIPLFNRLYPILPIYLIRIDQDQNVVRDSRGYCIQCEIGEPGLVVGQIGRSTKHEYAGYANNKEASDKKIVYNLFRKGQNAFNSGDLCVMDWEGFIYFVDRLGDTYRWKGENVSTYEVENVISKHLDSTLVVSYGVQVPNHEGRAGMAAILRTDVDMDDLGEHLKKALPPYAKPMFIRLTPNVEHTGSMKPQKHKLLEENFNVKLIADQVYYYDLKAQKYALLDSLVYEKIMKGSISF